MLHSVYGFDLKQLSENKAVFENLEHDFPQRIIYERRENEMHVRIEGTIGNKKRTMRWLWKLQSK